MTFAYADPPYPGKSKYYPERAEVDHTLLVNRLLADYPDGWALSTSSEALRDVLLLCPPTVRVCAWFKGQRPTRSRRALVSWEPLIVCGGRPLRVSDENRPVVCDVADGLIAQGRFRAFPGAMVGMKPPSFAEWMFRLLGASRDDRLDDLYPGSGAVSVAWARWTGRGDIPETRPLWIQKDASARIPATQRGSDGSLAAASDVSLSPDETTPASRRVAPVQ